jgi:hypothetical protein
MTKTTGYWVVYEKRGVEHVHRSKRFETKREAEKERERLRQRLKSQAESARQLGYGRRRRRKQTIAHNP